MDTTQRPQGNARVTFIGHGHGYFVTSYQTRYGVTQHVSLAGPFTTREQAEKAAARLNAAAVAEEA